MAAKIFNKFKEPKYAEFSRKDLVVDIKNGDLYYKSNLGVHKVPNEVSSDTFGLPPTTPSPAVETFKASGQRDGDSSITGSLTLIGNITASGIISASGVIFAGLNNTPTPTSVYYNTTTGELSYGAGFTAAGISGSWQSQTFATVTAAGISGSWQSQYFNTLTAAAISGSWQSQNFISASQTFLTTGQRSGSAGITGSLTVTGTITAQEFHTEFVSSSIIFTSGSTQFGNSSDDTHTFSGSIHVKDEGHITASGNISASGLLYSSASLGFDNIATYNSTSGQYFYTSSQGLSEQLDTFKQTGQRSGDSAITGSFEVTSDITSSKLLIQKSAGPGFTAGTSDIAIFQNNATNQDASIAIISDDGRKSQLHFGRSGSIDQGSIKYLHHGNASGPDKMLFKVSGSNIVTFSNPPSLGSSRGAIGVGGDHNYPTDYFHAQGSLSGKGLMLSSSNGTGITIDRGTTSSLGTLKFNTDQTTDWTLGNINGDDDNNFYIYNGDGTGDKHISLTPTSTTFHTNVTASNNISASGAISASGILTSGQVSEFNKTGGATVGDIFIPNTTSNPQIYFGRLSGVSGDSSEFDFRSRLNQLKLRVDTAGSGDITGKFESNANGSFVLQRLGGDNGILFQVDEDGGNIQLNGPVTASGNISASGKLYAGLSAATPSDSVFYNTTTGELSYGTAASSFTAIGISGSWQSQGFISGSQVTENLPSNTLSSSFQIESDISGAFTLTSASIATNIATNVTNISTNTNAISALNSAGLISASALSTTGQGLVQLTTNGVATTVDLGLEATDSPMFNHITASGNISSSGTLYGSEAYIKGHITASGNIETTGGYISASGKLYGGLREAASPHMVYYNPIGGELTYEAAVSSFTAEGISGSWQGQNFISGAQVLENLNSNTLSSSAQIATDISGAFNGVTGSFLLNTTDTLTGDLTVTGTITAQEFHTEFVSASIIFQSGSTQFGNSADDIHTFSGSINVKDGSITGSKMLLTGSGSPALDIRQSTYAGSDGPPLQIFDGYYAYSIGLSATPSYDPNTNHFRITKSASRVTFSNNKSSGFSFDKKVQIGEHKQADEALTVTGNISASGKLYSGLANTTTTDFVLYNTSTGELSYDNPGILSSSAQIATNISGAIDAATGSLLGSYTFLSSSAQIATNISGAIDAATGSLLSSYTFLSSSAQIADDISGSFLLNTTDTLTGDLTVTNNITSSGNISASGDVYANTYWVEGKSAIDYVVGNTKIIYGQDNQNTRVRGATIELGADATQHTTASGNISASGDGYFANVGIGTTTPVDLLQIGAGGAPSFTTDPDIATTVASTTNGHEVAYQLHANEGTNNIRSKYFVDDTTLEAGFDTSYSTGLSGFVFQLVGSEKMRINVDGKVGIGTATPPEKLTVEGNISASGAIHTQDKFVVRSSGDLLRIEKDSWTNATNHSILYNGWQTSTDDYVYLKAGGNSTTSHGIIAITDNAGFLVGNTNDETGAVLDNTAGTFGLDRLDFRVDASGNVTASGNISASGTLNAGLTNTNNANLVFYNSTSGELTYDSNGNIGGGILSSSNQIATNISGAIDAATGSLSASIASNYLLNTTDTLDGDLTVTGTITAQEFHTEFVSASIIFESGSTQFGNSADDIHTFSGSINVKDGNITASGNISASGNLDVSEAEIHGGLNVYTTLEVGGLSTLQETTTTNISADGHITASGNISSSGKIYASQYLVDGKLAIDYIPSSTQITYGQNNKNSYLRGATILLGLDNTQHVTASGNISASGTITALNFTGSLLGTATTASYVTTAQTASYVTTAQTASYVTTAQTASYVSADNIDQPFTHITASGNISASLAGTVSAGSGSFHALKGNTIQATSLEVGGLSTLSETTTTNIFADGHITASGNISASGDVTANKLRLSSTTDASVSSTGHAFQAGATNSTNVIIDNNEIMARNNGALSNLNVNPDGGIITFNNSVSGDEVLIGNGNITASGNISSSGYLHVGAISGSGPVHLSGLLSGITGDVLYYNPLSKEISVGGVGGLSGFIDKVRFSGLNDGDTTVEDDGGSTAEFTLSGSTSLGIKVRGNAATSTIGIELHTVGIPESTDTFDHTGTNVLTEDSFIVHDLSAGVVKKMIAGNIPITAFNNDANYSSTTGTLTSLTQGTSIEITSPSSASPTIKVAPGGLTGQILIVDRGVNNNANDMVVDPGLSFASSTLTTSGTDTLSVAGDIIAFASDKRLKENIVEISDPIEKIKQLRGVTYDWKDSTLDLGFATTRQHGEIGLIAQELEKVIPQAVTRAPFDNINNPKLYVSGSRIDGETDPYKTIKMDKVVPLLIEGIKNQQKQIDELKEMIFKLSNKN